MDSYLYAYFVAVMSMQHCKQCPHSLMREKSGRQWIGDVGTIKGSQLRGPIKSPPPPSSQPNN